VLAIEANMPEAYRLNQYVLTGEGDARELLRGLRFWPWNTQELLDLVEWMRAVNRSGKQRVQFMGFDMQNIEAAMSTVRLFVARADSGEVARVDEAWRRAKQASAQPLSAVPASREFPAKQAAGRRIRFGGWIRTEGLDDGRASFWWRANDSTGTMLALDSMEGRGPSGTTPWSRYGVEMKVPERAARVRFGMLMSGHGAAWFDSLSLDIDGRSWSEEGLDFDFEDSTASKAWWVNAYGYESHLDSIVTHSGRRSLRLRSVAAIQDSQRTAAREALPAVRRVVALLERNRTRYLSFAPAAEVDWVIQNAMIVRQSLEVRAGLVSRDGCMTVNVEWMLSHSPPGTRMILWGHNAHVARQEGSVGGYLAQRHGPDLVAVGFAFHDGRYNAVSGERVQANDAVPGVPGSGEAVFHATGAKRFMLDLRKASNKDPQSAWLDGEIRIRSIGTIANDGFHVANIRRQYDLMVFVDHGTPSTLLP
jgi:erythromycin esterase-like protein